MKAYVQQRDINMIAVLRAKLEVGKAKVKNHRAFTRHWWLNLLFYLTFYLETILTYFLDLSGIYSGVFSLAFYARCEYILTRLLASIGTFYPASILTDMACVRAQACPAVSRSRRL